MKISKIKKLLLLVMIIAVIVRVSIDIAKFPNPEWCQLIFNTVFYGSMLFIVFTPVKSFKDLIFVLIIGYATIIMPIITMMIKNQALNIKITATSLGFILLYFAFSFVFKDISKHRKNKIR